MKEKIKTVKDEGEFFFTVSEVVSEQEDGRELTRTKKIVLYTLDKKKVVEAFPYKYPMFSKDGKPWHRVVYNGVNHAARNVGVQKYILEAIKRFHKDELVVANTYRAAMDCIKDACNSSPWDEVRYLGYSLARIIVNHDNERLKESFERRKKWISSKVTNKNQYNKFSDTERVLKEKEVD